MRYSFGLFFLYSFDDNHLTVFPVKILCKCDVWVPGVGAVGDGDGDVDGDGCGSGDGDGADGMHAVLHGGWKC